MGMTEEKREKVIKWLETCLKGCDDSCPYKRECESKGGFIAPMTDAIALLKAQEPVKPNSIMYMAAGIGISSCPRCGDKIDAYHNAAYCGSCGQAVKWE